MLVPNSQQGRLLTGNVVLHSEEMGRPAAQMLDTEMEASVPRRDVRCPVAANEMGISGTSSDEKGIDSQSERSQDTASSAFEEEKAL